MANRQGCNMSLIGDPERLTQNRVVDFFQSQLGYEYLGDWQYRDHNKNIETEILSAWLSKRGTDAALIKRVIHQLDTAAALGDGKALYHANEQVYKLLRYGIKAKVGVGEFNQTVWLIDWKHPEANEFAIAEEVSIVGEYKKRPDIVLYVNGIALGILELKRSSVSVAEGIRQNLDNQKKSFIRNFFTTIQLVMAGNDTQGLRYGTIETPERYYLQWKEEDKQAQDDNDNLKNDNLYNNKPDSNKLDSNLRSLCSKPRLLNIIHDFMVFDAGIKKTCRHNQFFGVEAAKSYIYNRVNGIIWHTQGSGKSLTEPPRYCRRLNILREYDNENTKLHS
jgi:type I restriction enzyme R subunit